MIKIIFQVFEYVAKKKKLQDALCYLTRLVGIENVNEGSQNVWIFCRCLQRIFGEKGKFLTLVEVHMNSKQISVITWYLNISHIFWLYLLHYLLGTCLIYWSHYWCLDCLSKGKFNYGCPLYYMGGRIRTDVDGCWWEGKGKGEKRGGRIFDFFPDEINEWPIRSI